MKKSLKKLSILAMLGLAMGLNLNCSGTTSTQTSNTPIEINITGLSSIQFISAAPMLNYSKENLPSFSKQTPIKIISGANGIYKIDPNQIYFLDQLMDEGTAHEGHRNGSDFIGHTAWDTSKNLIS